MMVHYRKDENGNIILSEYMFNRLMKITHNKEKENKKLNNIIKDARVLLSNYNDNENNYYVPIDLALEILNKGSDK